LQRQPLALLLALVALLWAPGSATGEETDRAQDAPPAPSRQADSGDGDGYLQLGHARLKAGDLRAAEKAFRKALSARDKKKAAEAYNGLGLVYAAQPGQLQAAVYHFQQALRLNPRYVEAQYNKAQTYLAHSWLSQAVREAQRAVALDSTYAPSRLLLEKCRTQKAEEEGQAQALYKRNLNADPEDLKGWVEWGRDALWGKAYDEVLRRISPLTQAHPGWKELLPILAQAYWKKNRQQEAWDAFVAYTKSLEEIERRPYEDIRLVASRDIADEYEQSSGEGRQELARRFWAERDPDFTTPVNERLLEHYRRVWYARTTFGRRRSPWDRRGEVYVRYGEPDHRAFSSAPGPPLTAAVNAVKERFFSAIYDDMQTVFALGGGSEVRDPETGVNTGTMTGVKMLDAITGALTGSIVGPVFPVRSYSPDEGGGVYAPVGSTDISIVAWESWVYTDVDGGIVVDFTDETNRGNFDYAPIPELEKTPGLRNRTLDGIRALAALTRRSPAAVMERAVAAMPERYTAPLEYRPVEFYFDHASFRGQGGASCVEVYYGVPMAEATYFPADGMTGLRAVCRAALTKKGTGTVHRSEAEMIYREGGDRTGKAGFIPHVERLVVPPGEYLLDVRVENRLSGEIGSYRKPLVVEQYPTEPLTLSDIQLAWKISEGGIEDKFSKQGLQVVPMPTRRYKKGQPVFLYYEIYNLKRDESGRVNYTVAYTILSGGLPGTISQMMRSFQGQKRDPEVSVTQERFGLRETEAQHLELDLKAVAPEKVTVKVTVTDLIGGQTASKETVFLVEE
jgi:GWxTD domain-containing protein